jgi:hypothetical protein
MGEGECDALRGEHSGIERGFDAGETPLLEGVPGVAVFLWVLCGVDGTEAPTPLPYTTE